MNTQQPYNTKTQQLYKPTNILKIRLYLIFIIGFTLGALTIIAWNSEQQKPNQNSTVTTTTTSNTKNTTTTNNTTASDKITAVLSSGVGTGTVNVVNQPAGGTVSVESVTVPPPGVWVAVRETKNGELGNVLGAEYVHGPRSNITVDLLRNTEPNKLYVIELYRPGIKEGVFNIKTESVYIDFDTGRSVIVPFHTTTSLTTN